MQKIKEVFPKILAPKAIPLTLMAPLAFLFLLECLGLSMLARAEDPVGLGAAVMALFGAIKDKAVTAVVVMHVFQILRSNESIGLLGKLGVKGNGMRVAVALLTTLGYVAEAWARSGNLGQAAIEGLFTSGGAMLLFDAFKGEAQAVAEKQGEVVLTALVAKKVGKSLA